MTNPVTKAHRLSVARAWEGSEPLSAMSSAWVDGAPAVLPVLMQLERLAQLVADAEGKQSAAFEHGIIEGRRCPTGGVLNPYPAPKPPEQP